MKGHLSHVLSQSRLDDFSSWDGHKCVGIDHAATCRRCHRKEDRTFNQEEPLRTSLRRNVQLVPGSRRPRDAYAAYPTGAFSRKRWPTHVSTRRISAPSDTAGGLLIRCRTRAYASLENNLANSRVRARPVNGPPRRAIADKSDNRTVRS